MFLQLQYLVLVPRLTSLKKVVQPPFKSPIDLLTSRIELGFFWPGLASYLITIPADHDIDRHRMAVWLNGMGEWLLEPQGETIRVGGGGGVSSGVFT